MQTIYLRRIIHSCLLLLAALHSKAQAPSPALIGYFHNWQDANAPYIQLDQVDTRYRIIDVAFAMPIGGTDYKMSFVPDQVSQATFISQMQTLQAQGRKILISIGGATAPITLNNTAERDTFVTTMTQVINTFGFDGLDIDLEGSSLTVTGGTISNPVDASVINLIDAVKQIMANYQTANNQKMILTMAPETAFVQGGQSGYGGIWGAYLPVIYGLKDSLDILHVQLYNSGSMYGINNQIYTQGTADFIVAMCEAVIQGFNTAGGNFPGLPASKVAVGLPACTSAAGGGFVVADTIKAAVKYLRGMGPQPGSYTLANVAGYPTLRGLMTWSINWDAVSNCSPAYDYADTYASLFMTPTGMSSAMAEEEEVILYPNPTADHLTLLQSGAWQIMDMTGRVCRSGENAASRQRIDVSALPAGLYVLRVGEERIRFVKQ